MTDYGPDLVRIHDAGFSKLARAAGPHLVALLHAQGFERGLVVELGCGAGVAASALVAAGFDVLGVDLSPAMVAVARGRVPGARFVVGSAAAAEVPPCVAVAAFGEVLNYVDPATGAATDLRSLLARAASALTPGGVLLFDLAAPGRGAGALGHHWEGEGWALLFDVEEDEAARRLIRRQTTFVREGDAYRRGREVHVLELHAQADVERLLVEAGFAVTTGARYGELFLPQGLVVYQAIKTTR